MRIRTRVAAGTLAAIAVAGGAVLHRLRPITGFPATPLVPGDRIIGQDRILRDSRPADHDNEACTVSFGRDVLCRDIIILPGQGDLQASWTVQWPATGSRGPASFDGGTG